MAARKKATPTIRHLNRKTLSDRASPRNYEAVRSALGLSSRFHHVEGIGEFH